MYAASAVARPLRVPATQRDLLGKDCLCVRIPGILYRDFVRSRIGRQIPFAGRGHAQSENSPVFVCGNWIRAGSEGSVLR